MVAGWPFVGRTAQLAQLADLVAARTSVLLLGAAGIGKSAIAGQLGERLTASGTAVGTVSGQALSGRVPFEAFTPLLARDSSDGASAEPTPQAVARELPARLRTATGVDVVLVVDDVHLLDRASVLVLHHLAVDGLATLVLTSSAPDELPEVVRRLGHEGRCRTVEIPELDDASLAVALERALGAPVEPRTERTFLRRADGNPLLLRELVAAAQDAESLGLVDGVWRLVREAPLARTVRDLVAARVADLPSEQLSGLEAVAATEPLPLDVAVELAGWDVLESLEAARLVAVRQGSVAHRSRRHIRSTATRSGPTCRSCDCAGCGWPVPPPWRAPPSRPHRIWSGPRCGGSTQVSAGIRSGCSRPRGRPEPSAWRWLSGWLAPHWPARPRSTRPSCWPRS